MDKLHGSSSKPLDKYKEDILSDDEREAREEYLRLKSGMSRHAYEKNEEQRR